MIFRALVVILGLAFLQPMAFAGAKTSCSQVILSQMMDSPVIELQFYSTEMGRVPFDKWFSGLRDQKVKDRIVQRLVQLSEGEFRWSARINSQSNGNGMNAKIRLFELKVGLGGGVRIYVGQIAKGRFLVIKGGNKSSQRKDLTYAFDVMQTLLLN